MHDNETAEKARGRSDRLPIAQLLDRLMKDRESLFEEIVNGEDLGKKIKGLVIVTLALLGLYGFSMGIYNSFLQAGLAMLKVPFLFFLTLLVCYPVLYVFNILFGSRLGFLHTLTLILASIATSAVILGAFAPITLLFVVSQSSYAFMKLLHVLVMGTAATIGLVSMYRALVVVCEKSDIYPKSAIRILRVWLLIFAFVGTQVTWALRPFVGSKDQAFEIIRSDRTGNFYQAVVMTVKDIIDDR